MRPVAGQTSWQQRDEAARTVMCLLCAGCSLSRWTPRHPPTGAISARGSEAVGSCGPASCADTARLPGTCTHMGAEQDGSGARVPRWPGPASMGAVRRIPAGWDETKPSRGLAMGKGSDAQAGQRTRWRSRWRSRWVQARRTDRCPSASLDAEFQGSEA